MLFDYEVVDNISNLSTCFTSLRCYKIDIIIDEKDI